MVNPKFDLMRFRMESLYLKTQACIRKPRSGGDCIKSRVSYIFPLMMQNLKVLACHFWD